MTRSKKPGEVVLMRAQKFAHRKVFWFGRQTFTLLSATYSDVQSLDFVSCDLDEHLVEVPAAETLLDFRGSALGQN